MVYENDNKLKGDYIEVSYYVKSGELNCEIVLLKNPLNMKDLDNMREEIATITTMIKSKVGLI